ncbi:MAG: hypothetical protein ACKV22_41020 [Bryobacteraceae bacterium]
MDLRQEIAMRVESLPHEMQQQVLQFVTLLAAPSPKGEEGAKLRQFASTLDPLSAEQMRQAIEDDCERVDADGW